MAKCPHCNAANPDDAVFCGNCGKKIVDTGAAAGMQTVSALETIATLPTNRGGGEQVELAPGSEFANRYVIEQVIGRGGMGIVYKAHDKLVDKAIALKLIRRDRLGGEGAVKRLIAEGVTTRDIRHDHVVAVYDVGEADGQPFVSMEYIEAISLRDWHRKQVQERKDVPLGVASRIIVEILGGLAAAHAKGVIHRDLKPENILLTGDPAPGGAPLKIVDFGIARAAGAAIESGTGTGLGTPRYMAPEQITNADSAGPSADLYSVSVIFYELLVDVLPQGHWQPPSGGRADIPAGVDKLIERGLSNRAANRPQSAADYRAALQQAVMGYTPPVPDDGTGPVASAMPWLRSRWAAVAGGGFALLVAIVVAVDQIEPEPVNNQQVVLSSSGENFDPPPPPPPPPPPSYPQGGDWVADMNRATYRVTVNSDGSFSGAGTAGDQSIGVQGQFQNGAAEFVAVTGAGQIPGRMQMEPGGHILWQTADGDGGCLHINHHGIPPGCPSQLQNRQ